MPTNTYIELDRVTVSTATPNVTFSNISQNYTDLVLVTNAKTAANTSIAVRVGNGSIDTGSNYSVTVMEGNGSLARSGRDSNANFGFITGLYAQVVAGNDITVLTYFQNYSNTTTFKNWLSRGNVPSQWTDASVTLWRSTSAINTIQILNNTGANIAAGSTFSLYGIRAEGVSPAPKATGGAIYSDDTYYYHVFGSTGTFTPLQSLTADVLVVAGGGGGSGFGGGGGGAGGLIYGTGKSFSATSYTVTVGSGGARATNNGADGSYGTNSVINGWTAIGGGAGAHITTGGTGGSGGGGGYNTQNGGGTSQTSPAGATGYGNPGGGNTGTGAPNYPAGGGGGAGGAGGTQTGAANSAAGGIGRQYIDFATATGTGVNGYYAGGGGGSANTSSGSTGGLGGGGNGIYYPGDTPGNDAVASTGGGGGGGGNAAKVAGSGGSGIVIVRYAKA